MQDQDGTPFDRPDKLAKLAFVFENVLTGELKPHIALERPPAFPSRTSVFTVPPRVLIDNKASASHTVIEVNGRDRPGLLWELTRELTRLVLQVSSAKISTYGEKVVDVFYVKNLFGHKVEHPQKLAEIRTTLGSRAGEGKHRRARRGSPEPPQARRRRGGVAGARGAPDPARCAGDRLPCRRVFSRAPPPAPTDTQSDETPRADRPPPRAAAAGAAETRLGGPAGPGPAPRDPRQPELSPGRPRSRLPAGARTCAGCG